MLAAIMGGGGFERGDGSDEEGHSDKKARKADKKMKKLMKQVCQAGKLVRNECCPKMSS
jgi:hypothetical protein